MTPDRGELERLLEFAVRLARGAGDITTRHFKGSFTVERKADEQYGFGRATDLLQKQAKTCRTWGDAYGHVLVATGRADVMLDPVMNVWDCAALLPIVEEAGGAFTDWRGEKTIYGGNAISTNGLLFEAVMQTILEA